MAWWVTPSYTYTAGISSDLKWYFDFVLLNLPLLQFLYSFNPLSFICNSFIFHCSYKTVTMISFLVWEQLRENLTLENIRCISFSVGDVLQWRLWQSESVGSLPFSNKNEKKSLFANFILSNREKIKNPLKRRIWRKSNAKGKGEMRRKRGRLTEPKNSGFVGEVDSISINHMIYDLAVYLLRGAFKWCFWK